METPDRECSEKAGMPATAGPTPCNAVARDTRPTESGWPLAVTVKISGELAKAVRAGSAVASFFNHRLAPPVGIWVTLVGSEVTIGGDDADEVHRLIDRWLEADRLLAECGRELFESGKAKEVLAAFRQESVDYMRSFGYTEVKPGKWGMVIPIAPETAALLRGELRWLPALARAAGVTVEIGDVKVTIHGRVYDHEEIIAGEIRAIEAVRRGGVAPSKAGLGAVEFMLPAEALDGLVFRDKFRALLLRAAETGDWRCANQAFRLAGLRTRMRIVAQTGRAKGGFYWANRGDRYEVPGRWGAP